MYESFKLNLVDIDKYFSDREHGYDVGVSIWPVEHREASIRQRGEAGV